MLKSHTPASYIKLTASYIILTASYIQLVVSCISISYIKPTASCVGALGKPAPRDLRRPRPLLSIKKASEESRSYIKLTASYIKLTASCITCILKSLHRMLNSQRRIHMYIKVTASCIGALGKPAPRDLRRPRPLLSIKKASEESHSPEA